GDNLLREVGRRLRECLQSEDCLARFGGDEFAALFQERTPADVCLAAERMLAAMRTPYLVGGEEVVVGASIGIAANSARRPHGSQADRLLCDADTAMYRAKHAGGGRFVVFETKMRTALVQRASLECELRACGRFGALVSDSRSTTSVRGTPPCPTCIGSR